MAENTTRNLSLLGAVGAAIAASACCIGPLIFALLGLGGAGALVALEPYRPLLTALTLGLLGVGFYVTYGRARPALATTGGADDCGCEQPQVNRSGRVALWIATGLVALALVFPSLTPYLF